MTRRRPTSPAGLGACRSFTDTYDAALLDLDGVVYVGANPVSGAADALAALRAAGMRVVFVTNNASRRPQDVAEHLGRLGVPAGPDDVVTSAQAVGRLLAERLPKGAPVLVVGGVGLRTEVAAVGMRVVETAEDNPVAVAQGYVPEVTYRMLAEAALAVRAGALWVASNTDATMPSARGLLPGNGALVAAVATATGATPLVAGKPFPPLHAEAVRRARARRPLVVGDRLDTDIEGAVSAGTDALLVLSGVTGVGELCAADPALRPRYIGGDVSALLREAPKVAVEDGGLRCGGWLAELDGDVVRLRGGGGDDLDAMRAAAVACWRAVDDGRTVRRVVGPAPWIGDEIVLTG